jgi:DNA topoisomerase-1
MPGRKIMVVESPSKAPKIEGLLGRDKWRVLATKGHICVIDDGLKGLEPLRTEGNIRYKTTNHKFVKDLKAAMREEGAKVVYVGTDDDREGEAIGFHVCRLARLDPRTQPRLRFNAIEAGALRAAVAAPGTIDMPLVDAQMCRQAIDLMLGYTASPLLWKAIGGRQSLSAGRCQTPALTLVCEQHRLASDATEAMVWTTDTTVPGCRGVFRGEQKQRTPDKAEIADQLDTFQDNAATLGPASLAQRSLAAPKALTTARLQQQSGMGTKRCMAAAQKLYEAGAITYHRTDAHGYNPSFAKTLSEHIAATHGAENVGKAPIAGGGAHEAIRATDVSKSGLGVGADQRRLYKFIRNRTIASGMTPCVYEVLSRVLTAARDDGKELRAVASANRLLRPGWTLVESSGTQFASPQEYAALSGLPEGPIQPTLTRAVPIIVGTKTPLTEAKLVKTLESVGVGRPSTFASIVNKLFERNYAVVQDVPATQLETEEGVKRGHGEIVWTTKTIEHGGAKARLAPTPLGIQVEATCKRVFGASLAVSATAAMEEELDRLARGEGIWVGSALEYWDGVLRQAEEGKATIKADKAEAKAARAEAAASGQPDPTASPLAEPPLSELGGHPIVLKHGRYGPYLVWNGTNVKIKGRKVPNAEQAAGIVQAHLALQAQIRDLGDGVTIRPGKKGGKYGMVRKGKKAEFVNLKACPLDVDTGDAGELRAWIMSQV